MPSLASPLPPFPAPAYTANMIAPNRGVHTARWDEGDQPNPAGRQESCQGPMAALPQFPQGHGRCCRLLLRTACPYPPPPLRRGHIHTQQRAASDFGTKGISGRRLRRTDRQAYKQARRQTPHGWFGKGTLRELRGAGGRGGGWRAADPSPLMRLIIPRASCNSVVPPGVSEAQVGSYCTPGIRGHPWREGGPRTSWWLLVPTACYELDLSVAKRVKNFEDYAL